MLQRLRSPRPLRFAAGVIASVVLALLAPVAAQAACPSSPSSRVFAQFGDDAAYSLAPAGSFESGAPGWSLRNSQVVEGNESYDLVPGSHSLAVGAFGSATSPWVCISSEYPSFRVLARQLDGGSLQPLAVSLEWVNVLGIGLSTPVALLDSGSSWSPSPVMMLGESVPLWMPGSTLEVRLVFTPTLGSSWAVDDVFIDPYSR
jgi:hypothetical protein